MIIKSMRDFSAALKTKPIPRILLVAIEDDYRREQVRTLLYNKLTAQFGTIDTHKNFVGSNFCWDDLLNNNTQGNLFASFNLVECSNPDNKFPRAAGKTFTKWLDSANNGALLLVLCSKLTNAQMNTAWAKKCIEKGAIVRLWPITAAEMPSWIKETATTMQLKLSRDAILLLSSATEGSLVAATQCLEKLKICYGTHEINETAVRPLIASSSQYSTFDWIDAALAGQAQRANKIFLQLKGSKTEPLMMLGALLKTIRECVDISSITDNFERNKALQKFWPSRRQLITQAVTRLKLPAWHKLLQKSLKIDATFKGQRNMNIDAAWLCLSDLSLNICNKKTLEIIDDK